MYNKPKAGVIPEIQKAKERSQAMKKLTLLLLVMSLCALSAADAGSRRRDEMPAPRLMLYKGTQTYEKNLILQKDVPAGQTSIVIEPSYFAVGETYAWSLRYVGSRKSMSAYSIFKIK